MAKNLVQHRTKSHIKHKGIQAKTKQSHNQGAQNYVKKYKGQGR